MQAGIYRHYKGQRYLVLGVARHDDTEEELVVYVPLYEDPNHQGPALQCRNRVVFEGLTSDDQKRFTYEGDYR